MLIFERERKQEGEYTCAQAGEGQRERGERESQAGSTLPAQSLTQTETQEP